MANGPVIERLSALPLIVRGRSPFATIVLLPTGTYFDGVWSIIEIKYSRMDQVKFGRQPCLPQVLLGPILNTLSHLQLRQMVSRISLLLIQCHGDTETISFRAPSGMSAFDDVFLRLAKFIRGNRLFAQRDESMSTWTATWGYLLTRALAAAFSTVVLTPPPLSLSDSRYFLTIS